MNQNLSDNRVFFIINQCSGRNYQQNLEDKLLSRCRQNGLQPTVEFTAHPGHATELAKKAAHNQYPVIFAVGGDGTVNEVANGLIHTPAAMGILPNGSGNGLARHLKIPMNPLKAFDLLHTGTTMSMDGMLINGRYSFNVAGIGFDGYIAEQFGRNGKRGLVGYLMTVMREFPRFREFPLEAMVDGSPLHDRLLIAAVANSSQFGNGATIAPAASICDGKMDICLIHKVSYFRAVHFLTQLFTGKLDRSPSVKIFQATEFNVVLKHPVCYHIDGEPCGATTRFSATLDPGCLNIITPDPSTRKE